MKVHKITLYVIDHDQIGSDGCRAALENTNYPNDCIWPHVLSVETADCGEWSDDHPLNKPGAGHEIERLFSAIGEQT